MRPPEWIAFVYFGYVGATALVVRRPGSDARWKRAFVASALVIAVLVALAQGRTPGVQRLRDWMPALYALVGYWIPGMLAGPPHLGLERWLRQIDDPLLPVISRFATRAPSVLLELLELTYLCCYPLVPCAFAWLAVNGRIGDADRYWTAVLLALYACYGVVPWLPTRPPRSIESTVAIDRRRLLVRGLNLRVLRRASIQLNTFPSGHTAGALAAAAIVTTMMPVSGTALGILAVSIATASVVGRYHYVADAWSGAAVAVAAFACATWW